MNKNTNSADVRRLTMYTNPKSLKVFTPQLLIFMESDIFSFSPESAIWPILCRIKKFGLLAYLGNSVGLYLDFKSLAKFV